MKYVIRVQDGVVKVAVNGKVLVEYKTEEGTTKLLADGGAFAIQAHDKGSTTLYKNIRVKVQVKPGLIHGYEDAIANLLE